MGKGPQIRLIDPTAISSRRLCDFVRQVAANAEIPLQLAVRASGGTDAKAIHLNGIGVPTIVIGVPSRYIHTHNSIVDMADVDAAIKLVTTLVPKLTTQVVEGFFQFL